MNTQAAPALSLLLLSASFSLADAQVFYSGNTLRNVIVQIDASNGTVAEVGFPGWFVSGPGMIFRDGEVQYIRRTFCDAVHLLRVDPQTLAFNGEVPLTLGGTPLDEQDVGGLAWDGSTMLVSHGLLQCHDVDAPNQISELAPDGTLSNTLDFAASGVGFDLLAFSPGGELFAVDDLQEEDPPSAALYQLTLPSTVELKGTIGHTDGAVLTAVGHTGMSFDAAGNLWLLERVGIKQWNLLRISTATGQILQTIPLTYPIEIADQHVIGLAFTESPVQKRVTTWGKVKGTYR